MPKNYVRVPLRKDTDESWSEFNPVLLDGELIIVEKDGEIKFKVGDGVTAYKDLSFIQMGGGGGGSGDGNFTWGDLKNRTGFTWGTLLEQSRK